MNSKSFAIVMVLILAVTLCVLPTTDAQAVMPVGPCTAILDTNGVPTGAFTPGCGGDSGFFWHAQFPALYILIAAMLYRDLTIQQIEGFPGQQWDTCANPNPPDA